MWICGPYQVNLTEQSQGSSVVCEVQFQANSSPPKGHWGALSNEAWYDPFSQPTVEDTYRHAYTEHGIQPVRVLRQSKALFPII
ncbi:hypothetical protein CLAIMM_13192 [Cladophialophora immunda]|nr:hypothetical protein CLAIMM_13192 [Cladophialophora immunda]